jgi:nucleoside-diphosphate-sugar epimerase
MTTLQGRSIALIGGAGFIGHNLATELVNRGADVHVIDSLQVNNLLTFAAGPHDGKRELNLKILHSRLEILQQAGVTLHPLDARDYHALSRVLDGISPNVVVQLAAVAHANRSNKDPYSTFDHSFRTLENALDCARGRAEHFVYFSSSMAYGNFETKVVDEDHPLNPIGIYGALKLSGEKIVQAYQQVFDLPYTIIRPSALYGPRCVSRRVCQIFVENAVDGRPLKVQGNGNEFLDFTYIEDLVQGICLTIEKPEARNEVFNLTYGAARTIQDLVSIVRHQEPSTKVEYVPRDKLMPFRGTLCVDKAKSLLGYDPQNPIDVGVVKYLDWYHGMVDRPRLRVAA